jgi:hypothetical protein
MPSAQQNNDMDPETPWCEKCKYWHYPDTPCIVDSPSAPKRNNDMSSEQTPISTIWKSNNDKYLVSLWEETGLLRGLTDGTIKRNVSLLLDNAYRDLHGHSYRPSMMFFH